MKILANLSIPAIGENYDVFIPDFLEVDELIPLLTKAVRDLTGNRYISSGNELICWKEKSMILRRDFSMKAYHVQNGDHFVLL